MKEEVSADIHPEVRTGRRFSPIWIVPIIALLLGLWLVKRSYDEKGELFLVRFDNAADIAVGKTEVKCSNVTIGKVEDILLNKDLNVDVSIRIKPDHLHLVSEQPPILGGARTGPREFRVRSRDTYQRCVYRAGSRPTRSKFQRKTNLCRPRNPASHTAKRSGATSRPRISEAWLGRCGQRHLLSRYSHREDREP